jgi:hypothetical protein
VAKQQGSDRRLTKAERKEQARLEREEIQRRQASRTRNRNIVVVVAVVVAALVIGAIVVTGGSDGGSASPTAPPVTLPDPASLAGVLQTQPPWDANLKNANERLAELNLPTLSESVLHHHIQLAIYVHGEPVVVPAGIGYSPDGVGYSAALNVFSPLHTHDTEGIVHVESADPNFQPVLGQFMDVWGVYFTPTCLGSLCNSGDDQLRVFVNGTQYTGDPTLLPLTDLLSVVITFGTKDQLPDPVPSAPPAI